MRSWRVEIGRKDAEQSIQAMNPRCPRRAASDALMLPLERCTQLPRRGVGGLSCRLTRQIIQPPSNRLHGSRAGVATHVHPLHSQQRRRATIGVGLRERSYAFSELLAVWPKCCWGGAGCCVLCVVQGETWLFLRLYCTKFSERSSRASSRGEKGTERI